MDHVTYRTHPSLVGEILLLHRGEAVAGLHVLSGDADRELDDRLHEATRTLGAVPDHDPDAGTRTTRQLDEYFAGARQAFDLPLEWGTVHGFARTALQTVCEIPYGQTAGYGEVAALAGTPRAARAVGNACARTPFSIIVPVHRVVHADGRIGGYGGHADIKRRLLEFERAHVPVAAERGGAR